MKISTKRNIAFGLLFALITFLILYSHCNENDVCYTFPFLNGRGQQAATKHGLMTVTMPHEGSLVFEKIHVAGKYEEIYSPPTRLASETNVKESEPATSAFLESREDPAADGLEEERSKAEPLSVGSIKEGQNMVRILTPTHKAPKRLNPPSDITGARADEILRKANVSRKELNRSLVRVERVDKALEDELDRERKIHFRHAQQSDKLEKELVRENRVDPTEEDELTRELIEEADENSDEKRNTRELFHDALLKRDNGNSGEPPVIVHPEEADEVTATTNLALKQSKHFNLGRIIKEIQDSYSFDRKHSGDVASQENTARGLNAAGLTDIGSVLFNLSRVLREITSLNDKESELGLTASGSDGKNNRQKSGSSGRNDPHFVTGRDPGKGIPVTSSLFNSAETNRRFGSLRDLSSERTQANGEHSVEGINSGASEKIRFNLRTKDRHLTEEDEDFGGNPEIVGKDKLAEKYLDNGTWLRVRDREPGHGKTRGADSSDTDRPSFTVSMAEKAPRKKSGRRKRLTRLLDFDQVGCDPLDPQVLLFNRIFKTGSSTTEFLIKNSSHAMDNDFHTGTTEDWYEAGEYNPYPNLINRKVREKLNAKPRMTFTGHFYFRGKLNIPQAHTYINQVREPIRRVVSHYHYMRSKIRPVRRIRKFLKSETKDETLEDCFRLQHKGCKNNVMTRFFCGKYDYCKTGSRKALEKAKWNIKHHYAAVGLLEHYPSYIQILHKRLPKFFPDVAGKQIRILKYNADYRFDKVPGETLEAIKKANWADEDLYSFIEQRFFKQAKACGVRIPDTNLGQRI